MICLTPPTIHVFCQFHVIFYTLGFLFLSKNYHPHFTYYTYYTYCTYHTYHTYHTYYTYLSPYHRGGGNSRSATGILKCTK